MGDDNRAALERANYLVGIGDLDQATPIVIEALRADPNNPSCWYQMARIELMRGNHLEAFDAAQGALAIDPDHFGARSVLASTLSVSGQHDAALTVADEVVRRWPHDPAGYAERARVNLYGHVALAHTRGGMTPGDYLAAALSDIDHAIELMPAFAAFHALRGRVLSRLGRLAEARSAWHDALRIDPTDAATLADLAQLDIDQERSRSARQHATAGLSVAPRSDRLQRQITTLASRRLLTPVWVATVPGLAALLLRPSSGGRLSAAGVTVVVAALLFAVAGIGFWWTRLPVIERQALRSQRSRNAVSLAVVGVVALVTLAVAALFYSSPPATTNPDEQADALGAVLQLPAAASILIPLYALGEKVWTVVSNRRQRALVRHRLAEPPS